MNIWKTKNIFSMLLSPFSFLYLQEIKKRKRAYDNNNTAYVSKVPIIAVGNTTKYEDTHNEFIIYLIKNFENANAINVGVVTDKANPLLISYCKRNSFTNNIYISSKARINAIKELEQKVDVIISVNGLQEYNIGHHIDIGVINGDKRFGNRLIYPAGPLLEPLQRLVQLDYILTKNGHAYNMECAMKTQLDRVSDLKFLSIDFLNKVEKLPNNLLNFTEKNNSESIAEFKEYQGLIKDVEINTFLAQSKEVIILEFSNVENKFAEELTELGFTIVQTLKYKNYKCIQLQEIEKAQQEHNCPLLLTAEDALALRTFKLSNCYFVDSKAIFQNNYLIDNIKKQVLSVVIANQEYKLNNLGSAN